MASVQAKFWTDMNTTQKVGFVSSGLAVLVGAVAIGVLVFKKEGFLGLGSISNSLHRNIGLGVGGLVVVGGSGAAAGLYLSSKKKVEDGVVEEDDEDGVSSLQSHNSEPEQAQPAIKPTEKAGASEGEEEEELDPVNQGAEQSPVEDHRDRVSGTEEQGHE